MLMPMASASANAVALLQAKDLLRSEQDNFCKSQSANPGIGTILQACILTLPEKKRKEKTTPFVLNLIRRKYCTGLPRSDIAI